MHTGRHHFAKLHYEWKEAQDEGCRDKAMNLRKQLVELSATEAWGFLPNVPLTGDAADAVLNYPRERCAELEVN